MKWIILMSVWLTTLSLSAQPASSDHLLRRAQMSLSGGSVDSAAYYARKAVVTLQQEQRWNELAYALSWLGNVYRRDRQYDSAFHYLSRALVSATSNPVEDTTLATTHHRLGLYYEFQDQPEQALQMYQQALDLRQQLSPAQPLAVATSYESIADVYRYQYFDYTQAEELYRKVLTIYDQHEAVRPENLLSIFYNLASTNRLKASFDEALEFGFKALEFAQSTNDVDRELCYHLLGNIYQSQGNSQRAISFYQMAIRLVSAHRQSRASSLPLLYNNLGLVHLMADSTKTAIQVLHQALNQYTIQRAPSLRQDQADTYEYLGNAYTKTEQFDSARLCYQRSLQLRNQSGEKDWQRSETFVEIAKFHEAQQQSDSALHYYQRALVARVPEFDELDWRVNPSLPLMRNDPLIFELIAQKANALTTKHDQSEDLPILDVALSSFLLADSLIDLCRKLYHREAAVLQFSEQNRAFYEQAIRCAYQLHQAGRTDMTPVVLSFIEKSKAIILWEALTDTQQKHSVGIPDSILRQERQLKRQMAYIRSQFVEEINLSSPDPQRLAQLRTEQYEVGQQQDVIAQRLAQDYPQYYTIKYEQSASLFEQASTYATTHNTTLIDYFWGKKHLYAVSVTGTDATLKQLPMTDSLVYALTAFQWSVQDRPRHNISRREYRSFTKVSHTLYQHLLAPYLSNSLVSSTGLFTGFRQAQRENYAPSLTIIPDGPLSFIPFDCLLTQLPTDSAFSYKRLSYLLRTHSVSYAQSLRVLTQRTRRQQRRLSSTRFLAFSYSDDQDTSSAPLSRSTLQNLPGAAQEIAALQRMAEGDVFQGRQATERQFKESIGNQRIIHLAVHGQASSANPNNNRLIFRPGPDSIDDGYLYSYELYELQLPTDLTVLSTCESGMGKLQLGEGVYSLARGFAYAGCPSVMMSLWRVDDQQTSNLMPGFYRALFAGRNKVDALRDAKIEYLRQSSSYNAHPYFWAGFVLEGSPSAIVSYQPTRYLFLVTVVLSLTYFSLTLRQAWLRRNRKRNQAIRY